MLRTSREMGVPVVRPSKTPERISTVSASLRGVVMSLWPGRRRSSSAWISAAVIGRRGGQPSITTPMAGPWLSPQVVMRKIWPKLLGIERCKVGTDPQRRKRQNRFCLRCAGVPTVSRTRICRLGNGRSIHLSYRDAAREKFPRKVTFTRFSHSGSARPGTTPKPASRKTLCRPPPAAS